MDAVVQKKKRGRPVLPGRRDANKKGSMLASRLDLSKHRGRGAAREITPAEPPRDISQADLRSLPEEITDEPRIVIRRVQLVPENEPGSIHAEEERASDRFAFDAFVKASFSVNVVVRGGCTRTPCGPGVDGLETALAVALARYPTRSFVACASPLALKLVTEYLRKGAGFHRQLPVIELGGN